MWWIEIISLTWSVCCHPVLERPSNKTIHTKFKIIKQHCTIDLNHEHVYNTNIGWFDWSLVFDPFPQTRPTATRQRKASERNACSTWTGQRNSKTTWRIKTSRARSPSRRRRAMTSRSSSDSWCLRVFSFLFVCVCIVGATVTARERTPRRRSCRSN